jgi:quercetin dioxygenase-like cupin family protein
VPRLVGFSRFASLLEEQIGEKISRRILSGDQGMIVWWSIGAGVHVEPHSHANEQIVWMLKGKMEFRLGSETGRATLWLFREALSTRHGPARTPR